MLVETDDIKLAPNHGEMPSLLARMKPSALVKHVHLQKVRVLSYPARHSFLPLVKTLCEVSRGIYGPSAVDIYLFDNSTEKCFEVMNSTATITQGSHTQLLPTT